MVIIDTSAWIEFFHNNTPLMVDKVDHCLNRHLVGMGDLIYCEIMQGIRNPHDRATVSSFLLSLPQFDMVGFAIAQQSAANYRLLRSRGVTVRKTIDVLIGTFCAVHGFQILHCDVDFDRMAKHIGLKIY